ncbi:2-C-methyl-D-erythritol 2,4-cyclodiphosphate synthase [Truepera radiovictrix]|uniref:2-C-methyl-D-erythritol 2,4-cyclodiphosphate synthase n=1 Tax=Truepera radiovictrix (strain DSM 17093 / CIP 108686 / LMG 22925 / RQ-24) TaxID=649638 RepID=D7CY37_TRURR|nr:2-C-methyl-D-erythritol 2,4-cyclodiphosphate synthase [Truepera radiovictrix]ADI13397.1 2C-methyl-D-erythritol 2,4-cyclodiphosphate synthase [Truepera radiovictrix DSM 17093]WMT58040.1 2-C-methyl-D-erythritol 2,4-cyclodiphosphate synthase [Truepera radiovictrix]
MVTLRIGFGEDAHRLAPGRPLVLGGVELPSPRGAVAHSDGDALLHALADALLSSFALGDIGDFFPPSDPAFSDLDSREIVRRALAEVRARGGELVNAALTVTLDAPKLGPHRAAITGRVAALLGLPEDRVGVGFKTSEGLAPDHVQARATVLVAAT